MTSHAVEREKLEKPREIKKTLGKDDFLKIMITQMKNQDPTNPFKAEQMATEIAQFTSVEQLQNVNQNLLKMANQNKPFEQLAMTQMIGKFVTIDRSRFPHQEGQAESLSFQLSDPAQSVRMSIVNDLGEIIFEKDLGSQNKGTSSFTWDGMKSNTLPAGTSHYTLRVDAKNENGVPLQINPQIRSRIVGISFEGKEPVFLVGDSHHQDRVTLQNIIQVHSLEEIPKTNESEMKHVISPAELNFNRPSGVESSHLSKNNGINLQEQYAQVENNLEGSRQKGFPNGLEVSHEQ